MEGLNTTDLMACIRVTLLGAMASQAWNMACLCEMAENLFPRHIKTGWKQAGSVEDKIGMRSLVLFCIIHGALIEKVLVRDEIARAMRRHESMPVNTNGAHEFFTTRT
eukprot:scpid110773/ scgid17420/ 